MADDTFPADRSVRVFFTHTAPDGKRTHLGFVTELTVGGDPVEVVRVVLSLKVDDGIAKRIRQVMDGELEAGEGIFSTTPAPAPAPPPPTKPKSS